MPDRKGMTVGGVSPPAGFSLLSSLGLALGSRETDTALTFFTLTHNFLNTFRMSSFIKQPVHLPVLYVPKRNHYVTLLKRCFYISNRSCATGITICAGQLSFIFGTIRIQRQGVIFLIKQWGKTKNTVSKKRIVRM